MDYKRYSVSKRHKLPLLEFIISSLEKAGCRILKFSGPQEAPFRISFEDPAGQRQGIIVYAFFANSKPTKNRPDDEHRFQIKYGKKDGTLHTIWQDPYQIYTTLMVGIDTERGIFVGIDPTLHNLTKFFVSIEFKRCEVNAIRDKGWHVWERSRRTDDLPVETVVGGKSESFMDFIRFEQAAKGMDQGHRFLLAEKIKELSNASLFEPSCNAVAVSSIDSHRLAKEFEISEHEILNLIQAAPRLKMAVRGWVAERHLGTSLQGIEGVDSCIAIEEDGRPDFKVIFRGSRPILIECKNVLRKTLVDGTIRVDFQKTRASKSDACSRFYRPSDFDVLAACLHPCTENWEFAFRLTNEMDLKTRNCPEHLDNNVKISNDWETNASQIFQRFLK